MNISTREFENKLTEQQRHMDWHAQECSTSEPEQFAYYQKEYYSLMRQRTETQRLYAEHLRKKIAQLKANKQARRQRNELKRTYFHVKDEVERAHRALQALGHE